MNQEEILQIGNPILRKIAKEVTEVNSSKIQTLIDQLMIITKKSNGVGIAAPQVGKSSRIIIVASHPNIRYPDAPFLAPIIMINPRIIHHSEELLEGIEGCLSVKEKRGNVSRYRDVIVEYITRDGNIETKEYNNFIARIIQHEIDHLNGILFVDYLDKQKQLNY